MPQLKCFFAIHSLGMPPHPMLSPTTWMWYEAAFPYFLCWIQGSDTLMWDCRNMAKTSAFSLNQERCITTYSILSLQSHASYRANQISWCGGLTFAGHHQVTLSYSLPSAGRRRKKVRWQKLVGQDKISLIKAKAKVLCRRKGIQKIYSLLPISRRCPDCPGRQITVIMNALPPSPPLS